MKLPVCLIASAGLLLGLIAPGALGADDIQRDAQGVPVQGPVTFDAGAAPALEVKRIKSGHILVKPRVNGHDAGWFIFDTGAGICCISTPQVAGLDLASAGSIQATGVGGSKEAKLYTAKSLQLGPATFRDHPLMEVDLAFLEPLVGEKICGIIGYGVLSKCVGEIDLAAPAVSLSDPASYKLQSGNWTSADLGDRVPVVAGQFEGHDGRFRLDLGANGSVTFHKAAVDKYKMLEGRDVRDCKMGGVGGFVAGKRGKISSLQLGGTTFDNVDADFALEAKGSFGDDQKDANIGTDILKRFVIITDYPNNRLALIPKQPSSTPTSPTSPTSPTPPTTSPSIGR
ncbi:MAG: retropepsin-like domain-containing protein [Planctomycetes bacterium]|nr:retropepsin-like domain-containing protein [Planctomycetota bacterium]